MLLKSSYPVRQIFALLLLNCSNFGLEAPRAFGLPEVSRELGLGVSGRAGVGGAGWSRGAGGFRGQSVMGYLGPALVSGGVFILVRGLGTALSSLGFKHFPNIS